VMGFAVASRNRAVTGALGGAGMLFLEIDARSQAPMSTADQLISVTVCCPRGLISAVSGKRLRGKQLFLGVG
jgi:hypothetical protein